MPAFEAGLAYLKSLGLTVKTGRLDFPATGYLNRSDTERAEEFNGFLRDHAVDAIFCTRGGYGTLRLLPLIDYAAAKQNPKLLVGYSDVTALQLALYEKSGWVSLSGPMVAVEWAGIHPACERQFWSIVAGETPAPFLGPAGEPLQPINPGNASGTLLGGNLSMLTRLIGTPYLPSLKGAILFLEDVNEPAYRVDAMLAQLKLSQIWHQLGGLVIGQFTEEDAPAHTPAETLEVFRDYCGDVPYPVASGLRYGHIPVKNAMPIGVQAKLVVSDKEAALSILEPLVQESARHT